MIVGETVYGPNLNPVSESAHAYCAGCRRTGEVFDTPAEALEDALACGWQWLLNVSGERDLLLCPACQERFPSGEGVPL